MRKLLQSQRQLRRKRLSAIKKGIVALIDVGSSKVMCLVISIEAVNQVNKFGNNKEKEGMSFRVIGASTTKSRGIRYGEIYEMREAESAAVRAGEPLTVCANITVFCNPGTPS